jgi:phage tail-like protein
LIEGVRIQFGPFLLRYERLTTLPSAQPDEHISSNGGSDGSAGSGGEPYPVPQIQYPMGGNDGNGGGGSGILQGYRPTPPSGSSTPAVPPGRPGTKFRQARVGDRVTYRSPVNNGLVAQTKLRAYALELPTERSNWLQYLPAIFSETMVDHNGANHNDFLGRYLMIFETILNPITWIIDNLDLYLSPETAPDIWLEWLSTWFDILLVPELSSERKRDILRQIDWLYLRRGTRMGMQRLLQLYFGVPVEIVESPDQPCEFEVRMPLDQSELALSDDRKSELAQQLIDSQKPGFTVGRLVDTSRQ